jgi:DNA-binding XRE family transcriptional regulator
MLESLAAPSIPIEIGQYDPGLLLAFKIAAPCNAPQEHFVAVCRKLGTVYVMF